MRRAATLTVRLAARAGDEAELRRVAELDSTRAPEGRVLVAELDGRVVAWLEPASRRTAADPFVPTAEAVDVLRLRAAQLRPAAASSMTRTAAMLLRAARRLAVARVPLDRPLRDGAIDA